MLEKMGAGFFFASALAQLQSNANFLPGLANMSGFLFMIF